MVSPTKKALGEAISTAEVKITAFRRVIEAAEEGFVDTTESRALLLTQEQQLEGLKKTYRRLE